MHNSWIKHVMIFNSMEFTLSRFQCVENMIVIIVKYLIFLNNLKNISKIDYFVLILIII